MRKWHKIIGYISVVYLIVTAGCLKLFNGSNEWSKTYGGTNSDYGFSVQQTYDGGYIIAGGTTSFGMGYNDVYLIKTNANGHAVWTKTFGGTENDWSYSVKQTPDSGYIIAGATNSYGAGGFDVYLIKTNQNGDEIWTKTFGGPDADLGYSVQQAYDGGYIIAGYTYSFGAGMVNIYLIKTDENGNLSWAKTLGGNENSYGCSVEQTLDNGYIIAGFKSNSWPVYDVCLIKTDEYGDSVWTKKLGEHEGEKICSVQPISGGGYVVVWGSTIVKTSTNGDPIWSNVFAETDIERGRSVRQTSDRGFIITGSNLFERHFLWSYTDHDVCLVKVNADGTLSWTKTFGGTNYDYGYSVQQTSDEGYIIAGYTYSFGAGGDDVYLVKTDEDGNTRPLE